MPNEGERLRAINNKVDGEVIRNLFFDNDTAFLVQRPNSLDHKSTLFAMSFLNVRRIRQSCIIIGVFLRRACLYFCSFYSNANMPREELDIAPRT